MLIGNVFMLVKFFTSGIRSLSFHNDVVTIGTGFGSCSFLDLRTYKFIQKPDGNVCQLKAGKGWLVSCNCPLY